MSCVYFFFFKHKTADVLRISDWSSDVCSSDLVEISPQGKILLRHTGTEIGTGMSTSQAIACVRWLGSPATDLGYAITDWPELPMKTSGDPYMTSQADQDRLAADPFWTPSSEERRVGKECVSPCRSRWASYQ